MQGGVRSDIFVDPVQNIASFLDYTDDYINEPGGLGAGVDLQDLINFCLENGLVGLEEFSGIPGSIGGCAYINIHYFEHLLSDYLVRARVIDKTIGEILDVDNAWFAFGYNKSTFSDCVI